MSHVQPDQLGQRLNPLDTQDMGEAKAYHIPDWNRMSHPERLKLMREISMRRGRDPRIAKLAVDIVKRAGAAPRQYEKQAAALLKWVQDPKNCYYVNEPGERIQDPLVTLRIGHGDCFAENTLVLRSDMSFVKIQDVTIGQQIWGYDRWSTVVNTWEKGSLEVTEIELNNGSTIRVTENHKVYVRSCSKHGPTCKDICGRLRNCTDREFSWIRIPVSDLREDMELLQPERIDREPATPLDSDESWLVGAYIAEGWSEHCRASVSGKDGHWKEQTKHRVQTIAERKGWSTRWHPKYIAINSKEAVLWLEECGKGAANKQIPLDIFREADLHALDVGLQLDASRNTHGKGWTFNTTSERLALQYRVLQRALGRSTSWKYIEDHGGMGANPIYRVGVRDTSVPGKRLRVKEIRRNVETVPCYDIATDDHYVYLPEADCTVSNCDDSVVLLCCLFESIGLPWRFVLSGRNAQGAKVRHIEGEKIDPNARWTHIYCMVGTPPFQPVRWYFCETTVIGVPLGWDVVDGDHSYLPEMGYSGEEARLHIPDIAPPWFRPSAPPPPGRRSPAYDEALGDAANGAVPPVAATVAGYLANEEDEFSRAQSDPAWKEWAKAVTMGVTISVATTLLLNWINGQGLWEGKGTILERSRSRR